MAPNEKQLVESAQGGDEQAFSTLAAPYRPKIFHLCFSTVKDHEVAEDLTQEAFISAYRHIGSFRQRSRFYTWLYRIALNHCINYLRRQKRMKMSEYKEEVLLFQDVKAPTNRLQKVFSISELEYDTFDLILDEALQTLSPKHRFVFEMFDLQGVPQKEIAIALDIAPGTVRSRLHTARKKIRAHLTGYRSTSSNNLA